MFCPCTTHTRAAHTASCCKLCVRQSLHIVDNRMCCWVRAVIIMVDNFRQFAGLTAFCHPPKLCRQWFSLSTLAFIERRGRVLAGQLSTEAHRADYRHSNVYAVGVCVCTDGFGDVADMAAFVVRLGSMVFSLCTLCVRSEKLIIFVRLAEKGGFAHH